MSSEDNKRKLKELEREVSKGGDKPKKKKRRKTTSEDVPGNGLAKKAAKAIEARKKRLEEI